MPKEVKLSLRLPLQDFAIVYAYLRSLKGESLRKNEAVRTAFALLARQISEKGLVSDDPVAALASDQIRFSEVIQTTKVPDLLPDILSAPNSNDPIESTPALTDLYKKLKGDKNV